MQPVGGVVARKILTALQNQRGALCDDCLAEVCGFSRRQQANGECTYLAQRGVIARFRGICSRCAGGSSNRVKLVSRALANGQPRSETVSETSTASPRPVPTRPDMEGSVTQEQESRPFGRYVFRLAAVLEPERETDGAVRRFTPGPPKTSAAAPPRLNPYGAGPFCRFRIPVEFSGAGVYVICVDEEPRYVGECAHLAQRFNTGYGQISPRNCYERGQNTNCKINGLLLGEFERGSSVTLWFLESDDRRRVESELLNHLAPAWNGRLPS